MCEDGERDQPLVPQALEAAQSEQSGVVLEVDDIQTLSQINYIRQVPVEFRRGVRFVLIDALHSLRVRLQLIPRTFLRKGTT